MERVAQEKDLGEVIDTEGKQAAQYQAAIGKANRVFGCTRREINYKPKYQQIDINNLENESRTGKLKKPDRLGIDKERLNGVAKK